MRDSERAMAAGTSREGRIGPGSAESERPSDVPRELPDRGPDDGTRSGGRETERRDELADRSITGGPSPAGRDRPDLVPDVEPPDLPM